MSSFAYSNGLLCAEKVPLPEIADRYGTPCYVYSRAAIEQAYSAYTSAFGEARGLICYAVKANSSLAVLSVLSRLGAGFDIVSGGELERVIRAGGQAGNIVFSGVGKTADEMQQALQLGIRCFNVESEAELYRLNEVAAGLEVTAPVALRVNPNVDARTHHYIATGLKESKFGIDISRAPALYEKAMDMQGLEVVGVDCHIGSQITELSPIRDAVEKVLVLVDQLIEQGVPVRHLDIGGGLGIRYRDETVPEVQALADVVLELVGGRDLELQLEPGRSVVGNAGVLLTRVEYLKTTEHRNFAIVDAGMNDLLRPSLYDASQDILAVDRNTDSSPLIYDVVGPVCESGDWLGKDRELAISEGDLLSVMSAGAYGFCMASNYNSRPRPAEVMVDGDQAHLIRARESFDDLIRGERVLP